MPWMWQNSEKTLTLPVDFCRDQEIFDPSYLIEHQDVGRNPAPEDTHWQWTGSDGREFHVPVDIYQYLPKNGNLARDVLSYLSQQSLDNKNLIIETNYRKITDGIGMANNGKRIKEIEDALFFIKMITVRNQTIRDVQKGKSIMTTNLFNFLDSIQKIEQIEGEIIPNNKTKILVKISDIYGNLLHNYRNPKASVPVAALEKANKSNQKLITPAKNLIYRLAARVPLSEVDYSSSALAEILGYKTNRPDRLQKSISNIIEVLYPIMISDYKYKPDQDKYTILLAGSHHKQCDPLRQVMRPVTPNNATRYAK